MTPSVLRQVSNIWRGEIGDRRMRFCVFTILGTLLVFGCLFWDESRNAVRVWSESPTFNWIFLVIPLSLFLIWQRRNEIHLTDAAPDIRAVAVILVLSSVWFAASMVGILEARQFAVMSMVQATLFGCMGARLYRRLLAPLLYLYFLVPTGTFLLPALQGITARFAVWGLHVVGIPVFSNGAVLEIPAGTFAIAEACAGLRFLIAAAAFGVFYAVLTYRSYWRRTVFIALALVVPVVANGLRVLGLLVAAQWLGSPAAVLADHETYGWVFFSVILILLTLIGRAFSDRREVDEPRVHAAPEITVAASVKSRGVLMSAGLFFLAAAIGPAANGFLGSQMVLPLPRVPPSVESPWRHMSSPDDWRPMIVGSTRAFSDSFTDGTMHIERYVALYGEHGAKSALVRAENRPADERVWSYNSQSDAELSVGGLHIPVHVTTWLRGTQQLTVWSFFVVNAKPISVAWDAKWRDLLEYLRGSRCVSAYEALAVTAAPGAVPTGSVERFMASSQPLRSYFCPGG